MLVRVEVVPLPVRLTVCGLLKALSVKISAPVTAPVAVGVKVTLTEQVPPAAMPVPQVLAVMAKPVLAVMLLKVSAALR